MTPATPAIETEALSKRYGRHRGIEDVSFSVQPGNAIEEGIDPLTFAGVTAVACLLAAIGAWLFERRDLAA